MTDYKEVYLASTKAYQDRDIDKMMEYVTDTFSWYNIVPDGARLLASSVMPEEAVPIVASLGPPIVQRLVLRIDAASLDRPYSWRRQIVNVVVGHQAIFQRAGRGTADIQRPRLFSVRPREDIVERVPRRG